MSAISKVIVVQHDRRAADAVRLGFEREGAQVVTAATADDVAAVLSADVSLIVAGASEATTARGLLAGLERAAAARNVDVPVLYVGNGVERRDAWQAGAAEMLDQPAYVRDVVTVGKLLAGRPSTHRATVGGDLGDTFGVFYLVRALAALNRSGVLSMVRGLRRGELRFFEGEVTSAQVGGLHGLAALHQLLLWTEARFEFRHELVVRRRQIPLTHAELMVDTERFLRDIRAVAGALSPAAVYELDPGRLGTLARTLPTEVHGVLRLFDGNRTIADVLEDCPFRVFETLRVAQRAVEVGLLRRVQLARPKAALRALLAVEEWLVGTEVRDAVPTLTTGAESAASAPASGGRKPGQSNQSKKKGKGGKGRRSTIHGVGAVGGKAAPAAAVAPTAVTEVDWTALVPRATTADFAVLSPVVPSTFAAGEINSERNGRGRGAREGLEALTDAEGRDRLFATTVVDTADTAPVVAVGLTSPPDGVPMAAPDDVTLKRRDDGRETAGETAGAADADADDDGQAVPATMPAIETAPTRDDSGPFSPVTELAAAAELAGAGEVGDPAPMLDLEGRAAAAAEAEAALARAQAEAAATTARVQAEAAAKALADAAAAQAEAEAKAHAARAQVDVAARAHATRAQIEAAAQVKAQAAAAAEAAAQAAQAATRPQPFVAPVDITAPSPAPQMEPISEPVTTPVIVPAPAVTAPADSVASGAPMTSADRSERSGEIKLDRRRPSAPPPVGGPTILVDGHGTGASGGRGSADTDHLASDMAAVHAAVSAVAATAQKRRSRDMAAVEPGIAAEVAEARADVAVIEAKVSHFTDDEEAFFHAGSALHHPAYHQPHDSFADLDEGYQPQTFWQRLWGSKKRRKRETR